MNGGAMMYKNPDNEFHFKPREHEELVFRVIDEIFKWLDASPPNVKQTEGQYLS